MKFIFFILLLLFVFSSLSAEYPTLKEKMEIAKKDVNYEIYISPFVTPDLGFGCTKRTKLKRSYHEGTFLFHADLLPSVLAQDNSEFYKIYLWGIKYRSTYFRKPDYSGFNWFFNAGFDSFLMDLPLDPGGNSGIYDPNWYVFPDLSVGCGYSWKLKNGHFFRISLDAGLKLILSNLYFSYVW